MFNRPLNVLVISQAVKENQIIKKKCTVSWLNVIV